MAFAPVFQRPFSGTFDRHAAAAAAAAWYTVAGKTCVAAYTGIYSVSVIRVDGYSNDVTSTEVDRSGSEYESREGYYE